MLVLEKDVDYTSNIQPICLPPIHWINKQLVEGLIAGWGLSEKTSRTTPEAILRKTEMNAPPTNEFCFLTHHELAQLSSNRTFCSGGNERGPCNGDSGKVFKIKYNILESLSKIS